MPYVSDAQRRKFNSDPKLKKLAPEWNATSKGLDLPDHVRKAKASVQRVMGGKKKKPLV